MVVVLASSFHFSTSLAIRFRLEEEIYGMPFVLSLLNEPNERENRQQPALLKRRRDEREKRWPVRLLDWENDFDFSPSDSFISNKKEEQQQQRRSRVMASDVAHGLV